MMRLVVLNKQQSSPYSGIIPMAYTPLLTRKHHGLASCQLSTVSLLSFTNRMERVVKQVQQLHVHSTDKKLYVGITEYHVLATTKFQRQFHHGHQNGDDMMTLALFLNTAVAPSIMVIRRSQKYLLLSFLCAGYPIQLQLPFNDNMNYFYKHSCQYYHFHVSMVNKLFELTKSRRLTLVSVFPAHKTTTLNH